METPGKLTSLPAAVEVACYLIIQEALTNIIRHSGAEKCKISISLNANLHIEIKDQGSGLPSEHHRGIGLASMRQRAEELDGRFQIDSSPNGGTNITVDLPLMMDEV